MPRHLSLRQVEAFKAVIEHGSISRAAAALHVSQPAVSKMIANLEADAGLVLFDRVKGRLAPTERGARLYDEVDRIFSGVQQVENAVEAIRRQDQGRLAIGVMPALSGSFVQRATMGFLQRRPQVFCVVESRSSQRITEWLVSRKLDVGLVNSGIDNPYLVSEPLMEHEMVCAMPAGHPLAANDVVRPSDLDGAPFVSFDPESPTAQRIAGVFAEWGCRLNVVLVANLSQTICEFAAAGHGVSLVHPLMVGAFRGRLVTRRFEPAIPLDFQLCRRRESRNAQLVEDFVEVVRGMASRVMAEGGSAEGLL